MSYCKEIGFWAYQEQAHWTIDMIAIAYYCSHYVNHLLLKEDVGA